MRKEKGITLIALVITIIVLLILAGVAIAMLSGENGILKKAAEAKTNTETASQKEEERLTSMELQTYLITENKKTKAAYGYISNIKIGEKVGELLNDFPKDQYIVCDKDGNKLGNDESLATGMTLRDNSGNKKGMIIIFGDIDGDGYINLSDAGYAANVVSGGSTDVGFGEDCFKIAGDVNGDGIVNSEDGKIMLNYKMDGATPIYQSQSIKDPSTIKLYTRQCLLDDRLKGFPESYKKVYDKDKKYYCIELAQDHDLTVETLKGYFPDKEIIMWRVNESGEEQEVETGKIQDKTYVLIDTDAANDVTLYFSVK